MSSHPNPTASSPFPPGVHITPAPLPPDPATSSYRLNHLMLRVRDPEKSIKFYTECLGLHTIFIFNTGAWTIYYLGPRDVQLSSLGAPSSKGLLELYHVPKDVQEGKEYRSGNEEGGMGFGHLGFVVPDVKAAVERCRERGYEILKDVGEARVGQMGVNGGIGEEEVVEGYKFVFRQLAFVRDPDGYWVELVPEVVDAPPKGE